MAKFITNLFRDKSIFMVDEFLTFLNQNQLFNKQNRLLVAVSGGVDSIVLMHLLYRLDFSFGVAHCNFGLRGDQSDGDEQFVRQLADKMGVEVYVKHFDTTNYAEAQKISTQMAARDLRYTWFEELMKTHVYDFLVTAHHKNDVIETVIFNLSKGTGIEGLHGILPKNGHIVRPLLFAEKENIKAYAEAYEIKWREDVSNASNKYARNLIRNQVIPLLKKVNPSVEDGINRTVGKVSLVERAFFDDLETLKQKLTSERDGMLYIQWRKLQEDQNAFVKLFYMLKPYGFHFDHVRQLFDNLENNTESGKKLFSSTYTLFTDRDRLIITPTETVEEEEEKLIQEIEPIVSFQTQSLSMNLLKKEDYQLERQASIAVLDADKVKFPLILRRWKAGDKFKPLGLKGSKKVSDFLKDEKLPSPFKPKVLVLESEGKIIWVVGQRVDDRFKMTEKTQKILRVELKIN